MKGYGIVAVAVAVAAVCGFLSLGRASHAARLDVVYTSDVRGTLGVCG